MLNVVMGLVNTSHVVLLYDNMADSDGHYYDQER
jgi:hypothetical protein